MHTFLSTLEYYVDLDGKRQQADAMATGNRNYELTFMNKLILIAHFYYCYYVL